MPLLPSTHLSIFLLLRICLVIKSSSATKFLKFQGSSRFISTTPKEFSGETQRSCSGTTRVGQRDLGSLMNPFQMMLLYRLSKENRTSDLAHTFDIWSPASYFASYSDHLLFEWFLDGMIGELNIGKMIQKTDDDTLIKLVGNPNLGQYS